MQLETYISDLLYRYECVTIPNFGAFLTRRVSATIDESSNAFYPPKKIVSFNEQIQKNDGLLAHYIAEIEKIPFEVASKKIEKRVKILKAYLTQGETLTFKNIGDIVFNEDGKILFDPSYHLNYLTDSFGLSKFESPEVTREVYKETVEAIEKVTPITLTPERRKARPYFKYAAVALIALTMGGFGASKYYVNQIETHNHLAQEQATQQLETKIQEATFSLNPIPAITLNVSKQNGNYHIVAGAFRIEENCNKKVQQLKSEGYAARKIGANKYGLHQVVYASYENRIEALKALRNIKKTHNQDAWLMVQNLNKVHTNISNINKTTYKTEQFSSANINANPGKERQAEINYNNDSNPNIIPIIKGADNLESGFYSIIGTFSNETEKDLALSKLTSEGHTKIGFFFDNHSQKYYLFNEKFSNLETAKEAIVEKEYSKFVDKLSLVKVEN
ncbi:SPOR domain-containing protein [Hyunsoonleella aestuarii]|uniref:SPOR domain-containing protein n=1 Tax=Hyunsoonleella aestuarii TaxID=912802 RepID=A0ABP8E902_9FLAO